MNVKLFGISINYCNKNLSPGKMIDTMRNNVFKA
ncbi:MAG: hypothetical protein ACI89J_001270 [Hyphomicrobiaceae bacterium]|jgi:hypothetical protein